MNIHFYESLLKEMRERICIAQNRLLSGSFSTLEDYKYVVGKLKGLEEMESLTQALFKRMNEGLFRSNLD